MELMPTIIESAKTPAESNFKSPLKLVSLACFNPNLNLPLPAYCDNSVRVHHDAFHHGLAANIDDLQYVTLSDFLSVKNGLTFNLSPFSSCSFNSCFMPYFLLNFSIRPRAAAAFCWPV